MTLDELFKVDDSRSITTLCTNTKDVVAGSCFFCVQGATIDRHQFVDKAISLGAIAIVHSKDINHKQDGITYIQVKDVQESLITAVDKFYNSPSTKLTLYGVTGTNGKTSSTLMLYGLLNELGVNTGYMGTVAIKYNSRDIPATLTTPDVIELRRVLNDMVHENVDSLALEVSSQGLAMGRVDAIDFDVVGFTNLTMDHLDYHHTIEAYFEAKKHLFDMLKSDGIMVVNGDDTYGRRLLSENYKQMLVTYGLDTSNTYYASNIRLFSDHTEFDLNYGDSVYSVDTPMIAEFNVYNLLLAMAMIHQKTRIDLSHIVLAAKNLKEISGRVNFVEAGQPFKVVVDYSHTPDGFQKMYTFCRELVGLEGRIISVFGSAGGRDHEKRKIMGEVSDEYCDMILLTEDDPRTESVAVISEEIKQGILNTETFMIPDRYKAIKKAIEVARPNDIVVIMGKGLEEYQHGKNGKEPWIGDPKAVNVAWEERKNDTLE